jgi:hypothetical protein
MSASPGLSRKPGRLAVRTFSACIDSRCPLAHKNVSEPISLMIREGLLKPVYFQGMECRLKDEIGGACIDCLVESRPSSSC